MAASVSIVIPNAERFSSRLETRIRPLRQDLVEHAVYARVDSIERLRRFMSWHVFAVWDFMTLVKRLQRDLTSTTLPWLPPRHPRLARMINEIVLDEESDLGPDGVAVSHFELYLQAMTEVGANTRPIRRFLDGLRGGGTSDAEIASLPNGVTGFVGETMRAAMHGSLLDAAVCFAYAREDLIPAMFQRLRDEWPDAESVAPHFVFYLERHIELDGGQHGELARELVDVCAAAAGGGEQEAAAVSLERAIRARIGLWDAVVADVSRSESRVLA